MKTCLPPLFKSKFLRLTCIIDCFEIFIDAPKGLKAKAQCYSNYKKHSTVKFFIACTPLGSISFLSKAWGGRASDIEIVRDAGFIRVHIHIERIIGLMKNKFNILQGPLPIRLIESIKDEADQCDLSSIDKIVNLCAILTNLGNGIVQDEKKKQTKTKSKHQCKTCQYATKLIA